MRQFTLFSFVFCLFLAGCGPSEIKEDKVNKERKEINELDLQGHRGCRGLYPENTLEGFIHALDLGVTTLEMDVVITKDRKVLLSHEPWFSHEISTDSSGNSIFKANERDHAIFSMTFAETQNYDVGQKGNPRFPDQKKIAAQKPLLVNVISASEAHAKKTGRPLPFYNIETKCHPAGDDVFHPGPEEFSDLLMGVVAQNGIKDRTIVQSFDVRTLQYIRENYPETKLALLIENDHDPEENLNNIGFTPEIYSPDYELVDAALVEFCRERKMELIPWTVNDLDEMQKLINLGVDGIISDYPDKFGKLK